jgi:hypothetical protein
MSAVLGTAALAVVAIGVVVFASSLWQPNHAHALVALALEFWLAAGMLRLVEEPSWAGIATAAAIIGVRKVLSKASMNAGRIGRPAPHRR